MLASGSGSNLQALLDAYPENVAVVAGDRKEAFAFVRARRAAGCRGGARGPAGVSRAVKPTTRNWPKGVAAHDVGLVVGGGGTCGCSPPAFLERFLAILNVHPSLLPKFRGLDAVGQTLEAGVEETGVSVHFMVEEVDAGPVVAQETVPVLPDDTRETLSERLHPVEHRLLVQAVEDYFWGRIAT